MKRGLILLLILAILAINAFALDVTYTPVQDQVLPGQQAKYTLKLINNENHALTATIKSIDLNWELENDGAKILLGTGESVDFNAVYTPISKDMKPGRYGINYRMESDSKTKVNDFLPVTVVAYNEVLDTGFVGKALIDPQRNSLLRLNVANLKPINLVNLKVSLENGFFKDTKILSLIGNEKDIVEFQVPPNTNIKEGDYNIGLTIALEDGRKLVDNKQLGVIVGKYTDLQELAVPSEGFLVLGEKIKLTNNGNSIIEQTYTKKITWLQNKFAAYTPSPSRAVEKSDGYYVEWDYSLNPGESRSFEYSVNYRMPIIYFILAVIIIAGIYILRKKDLEVTKRILTLHTSEGNLAIMKVLIGVRNKGNAPLTEIKVMDKVPAMIKAPVEFGMIKPSSVKNVGGQTVLMWDVPHLKKGEEKVISYKIEGRVNLLDTLILPAALAKFGLGSKKKLFSSRSVSLYKKR